MVSQDSRQIAEQSEQLYRDRLQATLEVSHPGRFVAIEPVSGDHFMGGTLSEAIRAARNAYPQRISYALRVGHSAAVQIGSDSMGPKSP